MAISRRTRLVTLGVSAVLAVGIIGGATATFAQDSGSEEPPATEQREHRRHHPRLILGLTLRSIATNCDLTKEEIRAGFEAGQSINQIIEAKGGDPAQCQADVLAALDTKLDELVAEEKISEERAAEIYAKAEEKLPELMAHVPDPENRPFRRASGN